MAPALNPKLSAEAANSLEIVVELVIFSLNLGELVSWVFKRMSALLSGGRIIPLN
jgi:hypothetical protein